MLGGATRPTRPHGTIMWQSFPATRQRRATLNPFGSWLRLKGAARPDDTTCHEVFVYISIFVNCGSPLVLQLVPKTEKPLKRSPGTEHWPKFSPLLEYLEPPKASFGSSGSPIRPQGRPRGVCDTARGPLRKLKLGVLLYEK